jgi:dTMP kinase
MPRPDLVVLLYLSVEHARRLIANKPPRSYTDRSADIQEADADYLSRVRELYLDLAGSEPNWYIVPCERCELQGSLRSIDDIAHEIAEVVELSFPSLSS